MKFWKNKITSSHVIFFAFITTLLILPSMCVKKEDFKRCDQSGFCTRQRAYADLVEKTNTKNASPYKIIPDTVELNKKEGYVTANVLKVANNTLSNANPIEVKFNLKLDFLKSGSIRMHFEEAEDNIKTRFDVSPYALENNKPENSKKIDFKNDKDSITYTFGEGNDLTTVILTYNPFKIELVKDDEVVLAFNQNGYFNFEEHRLKESSEPNEEEQNNETQDANQENESTETPVELSEEEKQKNEEINNLIKDTQKSMWSESFKSHTDSKPFGPESIGFDVTFTGFKNVYGIPQHTGPLNLRTTKNGGEYDEPYRLYNLDVFEYILDSPMALYGSIPFMLAHKKNHSAGLLFINASEMWIDIEKDETNTHTHWMAESGKFDVIFFVDRNPKNVIKKYMDITGKPQLPQMFAISYHQCRWNYNDEEDVLTVDSKFDENGIPYDVIWLDIEHTDGKRYFTWDYTKFPDPGSTNNLYSWIDMNEPSVFSGPETTMQKDNLHYGKIEHREVHNIYGEIYHKATYEGFLNKNKYDRPFILSRAFFIGSQRYGATWTGDNDARWDYLKTSLSMLLSIGVSGLPFCGADIGGFFNNPEKELYIRWYQAAAFQPFVRGHSHLDSKRREPWLYDDETVELVRDALYLRYSLLPYWYTLFKESSINGLPMMRFAIYNH
ncbi:hypothetical protein BCR36DRAFT_370724 [Piromyces finnis]|uniref:Glucosidase II subunit alpha n=1 Tax=Piromyces finnis TaxID=1754191 RepID=A0A1Y1VAF2_9FUNG|nr:hypothetical protein BCR36DRAFT_370724 [Piromyces finnis]|eukprot:ORX49714.1 hypothetical protein BCR36DRAFT_370724 [Piromyces finnis]